MTQELLVNSPEWWEDYFTHHWDAYGGRDQTRGFMRAMLEKLPAPERHWLGAQSRSVHDWGCAFGDGVDELRLQFPLTIASGSDASEVALAKARERYPDLQFYSAGSSFAPTQQSDAIVVSNCLEHFSQPWDVLAEIAPKANDVVWVMVPLSEDPLMYCHVHRFDLGTNPARIGHLSLVEETAIMVEPLVWQDRKQLLLTYASERHAQARAAALHS